MSSKTPSKHLALVLESIEDGFQLQKVPSPHISLGSAIIRVLEASVLSYHREIYNGERQYAFPKPLVGGSCAIARISEVALDATALQPAQLVFVDCVIRGRDDPNALFLSAIHEGGTAGSRKLMRDVWRDGVFAEYAKVPLENCIPLNETKLCKDLGYRVSELMYMGYLLVPYGGLRDIGLQPGETVVICPATGGFGGAGVQVAVAMGARVIAMGRNEAELERLKEHIKSGTPGANIETMKISGDHAKDLNTLQAFGTIDAVLDISPPAAAKSTHLRTALAALRRNGRCSLMGFVELASLSQWNIIGNNITLKGKLMYERDDMLQFVKLLESGRFPRGKLFVEPKCFKLENWKEALDTAAEYTGIGRTVMITPYSKSIS